uniref:Internal scaffolding protein n=1 Tax=Dulem virus 241 TaxID=3145718 RepID=A0AAU8B901_9VIRU
MRKFDFAPEIIPDTVQPRLVEGNPCYEASSYDAVMYDESLDGDLIQCDMTQILLNQEKYRRLLGDMNVNNILAQMHPTQSTVMDNMTDEERFACVVSRHCQTMSERQFVLRQLASEHSELTKFAESMLAEQQSEPASEASAPAGSAS